MSQALLDAAKIGDLKTIKDLILNQRVNVNYSDGGGLTALHYAALNGHKDCLEALIKAKADVKAVANDGWTALHVAANNGHKVCLELLIKANADVNARHQDGVTALFVAAQNGRKDCMEVLIKANADVNVRNQDGVTALHYAAQNGHKDCLEALINAKADVNARGQTGRTALHYAAENGHKDCLEILIKANADVKAADEDGWTALYVAAENGHKDCLEALINAKADVNVRNQNGWTALHFAAHKGHKDCLEALINAKADVNARNQDGVAALHAAALNGHKDCMEVLIKAKADVNTRNQNGVTALHYAAQNGHKDCLEALINAKADVNARNQNGATALHAAAHNGHKDCLEVLIKAKADLEARNQNGWTALYFSAHNGHKDCLELLIKANAYVNARNQNGVTALHYAAQNGHKDCLEALINAKADVNARNQNGATALYFAAQNGRKDCLEALINARADVKVVHQEGWTALHIAAHKGHKDCLEALIKGKADVETRNQNGWTALHFAAHKGHKDCLEALIKANADANARSQNGRTALYFAAENGHKDCLELLIKANADVNAVDKNGWTPLHIALEKSPKLAFYLIKAGAAVNIENNDKKTALDYLKLPKYKYHNGIYKLVQLKNMISPLTTSAQKTTNNFNKEMTNHKLSAEYRPAAMNLNAAGIPINDATADAPSSIYLNHSFAVSNLAFSSTSFGTIATVSDKGYAAMENELTPSINMENLLKEIKDLIKDPMNIKDLNESKEMDDSDINNSNEGNRNIKEILHNELEEFNTMYIKSSSNSQDIDYNFLSKKEQNDKEIQRENLIKLLERIMQPINANRGVINCGPVALKLDSLLANLSSYLLKPNPDLNIEPVSIESPEDWFYFYNHNDTKTQLLRMSTNSEELIERCEENNFNELIDLTKSEDGYSCVRVELESENGPLKLYLKRANENTIVKKIQALPRNSEGRAFGLILQARKNGKGAIPVNGKHIFHSSNFLVDKDDEVYFLDAQPSKAYISNRLNNIGFISDLFYIQSHVPLEPDQNIEMNLVKKEEVELTNSLQSVKIRDIKSLEKITVKERSALLQSAKEGSSIAQTEMGLICKLSNEHEKAREFFDSAADHSPEANYQLGLYDELDQAGPEARNKKQKKEKNDQKAFDKFHTAAHDNHIEAQYKLGQYYENGIGTKKDMDKAKKWYRRAADKNHIAAQDRYLKLCEIVPEQESSKMGGTDKKHGHENKLQMEQNLDFNKQLMTQTTKGNGDCAIHAVFGVFDGSWITCTDKEIIEKRKRLSDAIRKVTKESAIYPFIVEGIRDLLERGGSSFSVLRNKYNKQGMDNQGLALKAWNNFVVELKKHQDILKHMDDHLKTKKVWLNLNSGFNIA